MSPEVATIEHPAPSPSGKYILHLIADDKKHPEVLSFEIRTDRGNLIFASTDEFYNRHVTFFLWDDSDRVWVYSGDLGTFFWEKQKDGWKKFSYGKSEISAPPFLKEKRSRWHKK